MTFENVTRRHSCHIAKFVSYRQSRMIMNDAIRVTVCHYEQVLVKNENELSQFRPLTYNEEIMTLN